MFYDLAANSRLRSAKLSCAEPRKLGKVCCDAAYDAAQYQDEFVCQNADYVTFSVSVHAVLEAG